MTTRVLIAFLVTVTTAYAGPTFTQKPNVTKKGAGAEISFAVSEPTDVAVYVLDAKGKVVRHLVAGMLGETPPKPLKPGLVQDIIWDGRDDHGKPVDGGQLSVRVQLGTLPSLDRMIGDNPAHVSAVRALAVAPDGTVYVHHTTFGFGGGASHGTITAFDRTGNYLRTVAPYAANIPGERLKGFKRLELEPGVKIPFIYNAETRALVPGLGGEPGISRGIVTADGRLILSGLLGVERGKNVCQLVSVNTDGSAPAGGLLGPEFGRTPSPCLAISPDGKILYATGVERGLGKKRRPDNTVYAFSWSDKEPRALIETGLNTPSAVAIDKAGNLYVADKCNGRVAIFNPDGSKLGELKTDSPERVEVHPGTGAIYVLGGKQINQLLKYDSWKSVSPTATLTLPAGKSKNYSAVIALDHSADPPVLWASAEAFKGKKGVFSLLRIEDRGASFSKPIDVTALPGNNGPSAVKPSDLILTGDMLYVWAQRGWKKPLAFDAVSGQVISKPTLPPQKMQTGAGFIFESGADGNYYVATGYPSSALYRFDAGFKPLPYPAAKGGAVTGLGIPRTRLRGMAIDAGGSAYVLRQKGEPGGHQGGKPYGDASAVAVIGPNGEMVNESLIDSDIRSLNSVRIDPAGNIYLALGARAGGRLLPTQFVGQLPESSKDPDAEIGYNYYPLMYGSIVKFSPKGGEIRLQGEGTPASFLYDRKVFIKGAQWSWFGASVVPSWVHGGFQPNICLCESPRFDVDKFGRSFFPDACGFRVGILDTAGNLVGWFGRYGNRDSAGKGSRIPEPELPIGWAQAVTVDGDTVFVGDRLNGRVLRVKLGCEAEDTCSVK